MTCEKSQSETDDLRVSSARFGDLLVAPGAVVTFADGLIGFPNAKRFVAVPHDAPGSPFVWLQSIEQPSLAFLLLPPALVSPGYAPTLPADESGMSGDAAFWAIVTVPQGRPQDMTANLLGPLVIQGGLGRQIVLDGAADARYTARHPIITPAAAAAAS
jgi:flagellar assembly factor FliW